MIELKKYPGGDARLVGTVGATFRMTPDEQRGLLETLARDQGARVVFDEPAVTQEVTR